MQAPLKLVCKRQVTMIELQRHRTILEIINIQESISIQEIVERFNVSPATARRDLCKLSNRKQIKRIRSGAQIIRKPNSDMACNRPDTFASISDKDRKIAEIAISLLRDGQTVAINNQDTATLLVENICNQPYSVITNYFPLAQYLISRDHTEVIVPGGQYQKNNAMLCNPFESLNTFLCADHMFVCADGLTESGIYKSDIISGLYEKQIASVASNLTVIIQKNTLNHSIGCKLSSLENVHSVLFTDDVGFEVHSVLKNKNITVIPV